MGLFLVCDQPFTFEHLSTPKNIRFVVMENDEDEVKQGDEDPNLSSATTTMVPTKTPLPSDYTPFPLVFPETREDEDRAVNFSTSTASTTTVPTKTPFLSDLTPFCFDLVGNLGDELREEERPSRPKWESWNIDLKRNEAPSENMQEAAADADKEDCSNHHQTYKDDTSTYDPGPFNSPPPNSIKLGFPESKMVEAYNHAIFYVRVKNSWFKQN